MTLKEMTLPRGYDFGKVTTQESLSGPFGKNSRASAHRMKSKDTGGLRREVIPAPRHLPTLGIADSWTRSLKA